MTTVSERQYTPGTYGPFSLTSGQGKTIARVTFTRTAGNLGVAVVWPEGLCLRFVLESRVQGNTWAWLAEATAHGGGSPIDRAGNPSVTSLTFAKPDGVDVRVTAFVLQTITTAVVLED